MQVSIIGIDLAKDVFQVAALNQANKVLCNKAVKRSKLVDAIRTFEPTVLAMEACGSSHYWGRVFREMGHDVRLIPPQHVKAFLRVNKTDASDALAICEAAVRPDLHPVPIKTLTQQDLRMLQKHRQQLITQRTMRANQIRGHAREYGVIFPRQISRLLAELPSALEDATNDLTPAAREVLAQMRGEILHLFDRVEEIDRKIKDIAKSEPTFQRLQQVPGIGPMVAAAFVGAVGNATQFKNGRQCAAWAGLVPRLHGSGGKTNVYSITKNGDKNLRTMFIHGARSIVTWGARRDDAMGRWISQLKERRGFNRTVVAMANKMARIAWAVSAKGEDFDMNKAFAS